jgi:hypothetical protein
MRVPTAAARLPRSWVEPAAWVALALLVRAAVAVRTAMPGRDGATYLWIADRVAAGDVGAAWSTVFHPGYPLLVAPWLALGADSTHAAQAVAATCAALATWPLWQLARQWWGLAAGRATAGFYVFGLWLVRYPAECLSEGPFYAAVSGWALAVFGARPRPVWAGIAAAAAYWLRPEGLALACVAAWRWRREPRASARLLLAFAPGAAALPVGFGLWGSGFTWSPKAAFNYGVGIGAGPSAAAHYLGHAGQMLLTAFEALGYVVLPLALAGVWRAMRSESWRLLLLAPLAAQMAVSPLLRSNARFLSGFGILLLPFAARALVELVGDRPRPLVLALFLALAPDLIRLPQARGDDRTIERELGEYLGSRLRSGERIVTEMPRLEYYAGLQPGPPRPIARDELLRAAAHARFIAVVGERSRLDDTALRTLGLTPVSLPQHISTLARAGSLLVYERR